MAGIGRGGPARTDRAGGDGVVVVQDSAVTYPDCEQSLADTPVLADLHLLCTHRRDGR